MEALELTGRTTKQNTARTSTKLRGHPAISTENHLTGVAAMATTMIASVELLRYVYYSILWHPPSLSAGHASEYSSSFGTNTCPFRSIS